MNFTHRAAGVAPLAGLQVPQWAEDRAANDPEATIVCAQFYVRHVGYHEEWYAYGPNMKDHEAWCRAMVELAREAFDATWRGTGKDMIATGVAQYVGKGDFIKIVHARDLPTPG